MNTIYTGEIAYAHQVLPESLSRTPFDMRTVQGSIVAVEGTYAVPWIAYNAIAEGVSVVGCDSVDEAWSELRFELMDASRKPFQS